ncbi:unnamed protein product, partial [Rotaria socialis]
IINDQIRLLIHNLSRLQKDKPKERPVHDDESEVPSISIEQKETLQTESC